MEELRGISEGARVPFYKIFILNLKEEFKKSSLEEPSLHCTDIILPPLRAVLHNEDGDLSDLNRTAFVVARLRGDWWVGYTYVGDLPSGGFGYNKHGVAFTLNCKWVAV
jgi:hypothetical protein